MTTRKLNSLLRTANDEINVSGRVSIHLEATKKRFKSGYVEVKGFNVVYFDVPQYPISGGKAAKDMLGVLGFAIKNDAEPQLLKYDAAAGRLQGEIHGYVDADYMRNFTKPIADDEDDLFNTPTQYAVLQVDMSLNKPLQLNDPSLDNNKSVRKEWGRMSFTLHVEEEMVDDSQQILPRYEIELFESPFEFEYLPVLFFEVAKYLCIQPVRIQRIIWSNPWPVKYPPWSPVYPFISLQYTGEGLDFGMPEARKQWAKSDVVFNVKDWVTLFDPGYWAVDTDSPNTSTDEAILLEEVNESDCIEVYFIDDFVPESAHGGGATWGLGTAGSKIITSDGNARGGIDKTHLAHELGHVLGLLHPWDLASASAVPASTGTLLCGSGWMNDNPQINSQENKDNLSNPLLTFRFKLKSSGPDCQNSTDCGSCP